MMSELCNDDVRLQTWTWMLSFILLLMVTGVDGVIALCDVKNIRPWYIIK